MGLKWKQWKIVTICVENVIMWYILLVDVFEKFRSYSLKNYGLYAKHYLSTPALSWDAMLDITKVELELISDADMYLFFEKFMGGGVIFLMTENKSQKIFFFGSKLFIWLCNF